MGVWFMALDGVRRKNTSSKAGIFISLVPRVGLEPTHLSAGDFESPASTNFATWASEEVVIIAKEFFL